MNGRLNLPMQGGYLHTEDGYEHRGRNEDGPIDTKPKFKAWPNVLNSSPSKIKSAVKTKPTSSKGVTKSNSSPPSTSQTKGPKL